MSVDRVRGTLAETGAWHAPARALRLEKPRETSTLGGKSHSTLGASDARATKTARRGSSQFDTTDFASSWHAPLLSAPFAAQVIAQATNVEPLNRASAQRAYRRSAARALNAFFFDGRS